MSTPPIPSRARRIRRARDLAVVFTLTMSSAFPVTGAPAPGSGPGGGAHEQVAAWREDLHHLAFELVQLHVDPFHTIERDEFEARVAALHRRIPAMQRHEIIVEMSRLVAAIGDGHTRMWLLPSRANGFRLYPLRLYDMEGDLRVVAVDARYPEAFGGRLISIGATDAREAYRRARALAHADNEMTRRSIAPRYLVIPEVLAALGVVDRPDAATTFAIELPDGARIELRLAPVLPSRLPSMRSRQVAPAVEGADLPMTGLAPAAAPLWLQHSDQLFWSQLIPDSGTLYVQINAIRNASDQSLADFLRATLASDEAGNADRLAIDLRLNGGGNNYLNGPLVREIVRDDRFNRPGRLFGLISRHTFSAASHLVSKLELHTDIVLVGEPTGASPNHYGDAPEITLPNSGLVASASSQLWQNTRPYPHEDRPWTPPHVAAPLAIADYLAGRDPALAAVEAYEPGPSLDERLLDAIERGSATDALGEIDRFRADPRNRFVDLEPAIETAGRRLLASGRTTEARQLLARNLELHPESEFAHRRLADALVVAGERDDALTHYRAVLDTRPERFSPAKWGARYAVDDLLDEPARFGDVLEAGRGSETLVLVPCLGCDARAWDGFMARNAERYRMLAVTWPGMGSTALPRRLGHPDELPLWSYLLEAMTTLLDDRDLSDVVLVGHSAAAPYVVQYASEHPERIRGVITVDGTITNQDTLGFSRSERLVWAAEEFRDVLERYDEEAAWSRLNRTPSLPDPERSAFYRDMWMTPPRANVLAYWREWLAADSGALIAGFPRPLLALFAIRPGDEDPEATRRARRSRYDRSGSSDHVQVAFIEEAGHSIWEWQPEAFDEAVASFVRGSGTRR